ncbi:helix-turn-helix domain-containing protein [Terriglobus aquaticus]|uniref:Helix-turn-helix domain-containing protein n=1 Tax=Terriglobus aquaticus TaxID=940139 RepID=A0ABW9KJT4_9BACT|nr:helix-turn-helix domain-containing protein [Terriglobus aquaticus]
MSSLTAITAPSFLDAQHAAAFLGGVNARTLTRWAREGYVPAYPLGEGKRRLWRFLRADLEQWMLSRRTLPQAIGAPVREEYDQQH